MDSEEWAFVLDYFRFLVTANNMYELLSPGQMGKLWEYLLGTFEEFRMMYPEISLTVWENEWCDFEEQHRYQSITKAMPIEAYSFYFGDKYFSQNFKDQKKCEKIWDDAHSIVKQYAMKNTLFPIPDIFESVYKSHDLKREMNPDFIDENLLTETANRRFKEQKVRNFITSLVANLGAVPEAFYLTEIKYPFLAQLLRACVKYQAQDLSGILNAVMTEAFEEFSVQQHKDREKQVCSLRVEMLHFCEFLRIL